jgi:hypothetical protein
MSAPAGWLRTATEPPIAATVVIAGDRCRDTAGLFAEWVRKLRFPAQFGGDWDDFADSLTETVLLDPEAGPAEAVGWPAVIVVTHAGQVLADEPERCWATFLGAVGDAATVRPDDEDAGCFRPGETRLLLVLCDTAGALVGVAHHLAAAGYAATPG